MEPEIIHLIVCDDVEVDPRNVHRINLLGLITRMWSIADPPFPIVRPEFCIFAMFTGGKGPVEVAIRIVSEVTRQSIFRSNVRRIRFAGQPSDVTGATFRIRGCRFPVAGLYWIECLSAQNVIGRQRLWVLPRRFMS